MTSTSTLQAAVSRPNAKFQPVVPLLGYFTSAPSEDASEELSTSGSSASGSYDGYGMKSGYGDSEYYDDEAESIWLVYKWEGYRPLNLYMEAGPPKAQASFFKKK